MKVIKLTAGTERSPYPLYVDADRIVWINPVEYKGLMTGTQIRCSDGNGIIVLEDTDTVLDLWTNTK